MKLHDPKKLSLRATTLLCSLLGAGAASADITVVMNNVDARGSGPSLGTVVISETPYGILFTPALSGLAPGVHGFHLHENPSCGPSEKDGKPEAGWSAGGHFDPAKTGKHEGPYGKGHLGDLPAIVVGSDGKAQSPVLAPRLKIADLQGRSLMIHAGGDNHADHPAALGGGGARVACGIVGK